MNYEHEPYAGPGPETLPRDVQEADVLEHWAIEELQRGTALFHDFVRYGNPNTLTELDCYLIETGAPQSGEEILTELASALTVLADMRATGRRS